MSVVVVLCPWVYWVRISSDFSREMTSVTDADFKRVGTTAYVRVANFFVSGIA